MMMHFLPAELRNDPAGLIGLSLTCLFAVGVFGNLLWYNHKKKWKQRDLNLLADALIKTMNAEAAPFCPVKLIQHLGDFIGVDHPKNLGAGEMEQLQWLTLFALHQRAKRWALEEADLDICLRERDIMWAKASDKEREGLADRCTRAFEKERKAYWHFDDLRVAVKRLGLKAGRADECLQMDLSFRTTVPTP